MSNRKTTTDIEGTIHAARSAMTLSGGSNLIVGSSFLSDTMTLSGPSSFTIPPPRIKTPGLTKHVAGLVEQGVVGEVLPPEPGARPGPVPLVLAPECIAGWPALGLVSVLAGQQSGTLDHLATWPGSSGRRRKLLENGELALRTQLARYLASWPGAGHRTPAAGAGGTGPEGASPCTASGVLAAFSVRADS